MWFASYARPASVDNRSPELGRPPFWSRAARCPTRMTDPPRAPLRPGIVLFSIALVAKEETLGQGLAYSVALTHRGV
ncbi:MAG: hypothetical protein QOJ42_1718 [Acidobacteriaceae bacterium]|jgi:hypothetical protein|nr:hypothetical protein [Acidobacteriaceae bacterium]